MQTGEQETIIHVQWEGPYEFEAAGGLKGPTDYGVYQIYGGHPVYGSSALLYIGLAQAQHFGTRIPQEQGWLDNCDASRIQVYVGRLSGSHTPDAHRWDHLIAVAERLLIRAHCPAHNSQMNLATLEPDLRRVHVLNWGHHRDLLPEVSGARWTSRFSLSEIPGYRAFSQEEMPG